MLIINGCVHLGTVQKDYSNRALDKFSECLYSMSFLFQKWPDISNVGLDIPSKKEANKKGEEKTMGEK